MNFKLIALIALLLFLAGCIETEDAFCEVSTEEFESDIEAKGSALIEVSESFIPKKAVKEGELVSFPNLEANDPDDDALLYTFSRPLDENGEWQTKKGDAGSYDIIITASDGENVVSQKVLLVVEPLNKLPLIQTLKIIKLKAGEILDINPKVNDPDNDTVIVTYSGWKSILPYQTTVDDVGVHKITVAAFDGYDTSKEDVEVIVEKLNHAPELLKVEDFELYELDKVRVVPDATDLDGDEISFKFSKPLDNNGIWFTKEGDAGSYEVELTASDGQLSDVTTFRITVLPYNEPPILYGVGDITASEGDLIVLGITAEDPEGNPVKLSFSGWMNSGQKQTDYEDAGTYAVTVTASDGEKTTKTIFAVTVNNKNRPPVFVTGSFN